MFVSRCTCPACGGETNVLLDLAYDDTEMVSYLLGAYGIDQDREPSLLAGIRYTIRKCASCGLLFQEQAPDQAFMARLYGEWIDSVANRAAERMVPKKLLRALKNTTELLLLAPVLVKPRKQARLLDFGMGWGDWCRTAKRLGFQVFGAEISPVYLAHAKEAGITVLNWSEIGAGHFDFINTEQVFEHLANPGEVLSHLVGALAPGGIIKLSVPNGRRVDRRLSAENLNLPKNHANSLNPLAPLEHLNCFDHEALHSLATRAGLDLYRPLGLRLMQQIYCLAQRDQHSTGDCTYLFFRAGKSGN
jgi:SAM-dependent methyltransferase